MVLHKRLVSFVFRLCNCPLELVKIMFLPKKTLFLDPNLDSDEYEEIFAQSGCLVDGSCRVCTSVLPARQSL